MIILIERLVKKRSVFFCPLRKKYFNKKEHSDTYFDIFIYRCFRVSIRLLIYKKKTQFGWLFYAFTEKRK